MRTIDSKLISENDFIVNKYLALPRGEQTEELALEAICASEFWDPDYSSAGAGIERVFVRTRPELRTQKFVLEALKHHGDLIKYVANPTSNMRMAAVKNRPRALEFIGNQTLELCKVAFRRNMNSIEFAQCQDKQMCKMAIERNAHLIRFVQPQFLTRELCNYAIRKDAGIMYYIPAHLRNWDLVDDEDRVYAEEQLADMAEDEREEREDARQRLEEVRS